MARQPRTYRAVRVAVVERVRRRAVLRAEARRAVAPERLHAQVDADAAVLTRAVPTTIIREGAASAAADRAGVGCGDAGVVVGNFVAVVAGVASVQVAPLVLDDVGAGVCRDPFHLVHECRVVLALVAARDAPVSLATT
eukprot:COSAG04_NODE_827_length_10036_cov_6.659455_3_plen_139_part_00